MERRIGQVLSFSKNQETTKRSHSEEIAAAACFVFATASIEYPSSITAQAAKISLDLLDKGFSDSLIIMRTFLGDDTKIISLAKAANAHHQKNDNGPKDENGLLEITPDNIRAIVRSDFKVAHYLMQLRRKDIEKILSLYPTFCSRETHTFDEESYHGYAYYLINRDRELKGLPAVSSILTPLKDIPTQHLPRR